MPTFDSIRQQAPWMQDWSDEEVMLKLSELTGKPLTDVAKDFGVKTGAERSVLGAGGVSGWEGLKGLGYSGAAAVADVVGAEGAKDWLERQAFAKEVQSAIASRPELEKIEEQTFGSALPYVGYQVAKQAPNIIGAIAAGAIVPEVAVPAALSRGAAVLPRALGGGGLGARLAAAGTEAGAGFAAKRAALETGQAFGKQVVGGLAFNEAQSVGSLYQAAREGGDENAGAKALAGSPLYALSETLPEAMLVGRFKGGSGFTGNLLTRMGKSAGVQGISGATSEGLQNEMEMALNPNLTPEQQFSNRLNSVAAGGIVEGLLGGFGGMAKGSRLPSGGSLMNGATATDQPATSQTPDDRGTNTAIDASSSSPSVLGTAQAAEVDQQKLATFTGQVQADQQAQLDQAKAEADAQAQQQAQIQAMQQQEQRNAALSAFGVTYTSPNQSTATFMGQPIAGTGRINALADELNKVVSGMPEQKILLARALMSADTNTSAGKLRYKVDGANTPKTVQNAMAVLDKVQQQYMIDEAADMEEVANILDVQSQTAKGKELEFINAVYEAITGKNTTGYEQSQGATNGKLQTTTGLGTVPEQGGASQAAGGELGLLQPGGVQPVAAGSVAGGPSAIQANAGRESGVRAGAGIAPAAGVSGSAIAQAPQVTGVHRGQQAGTQGAIATATQGTRQTSEAGRVEAAGEGTETNLPGQAEGFLNELVDTVVQRAGKMKAEHLQKYRDLIKMYMMADKNTVDYSEAAHYFGITVEQAERWSKDARNFSTKWAKPLAKVLPELMEKYNVDREQLLTLISAERQQAEKTLIEEVGGARQAVDERDLGMLTEEGAETGGDLKAKTTKQNLSKQERFNKAENLNARYIRLTEEIENIQEQLDSGEVTGEELTALEEAKAEAEKKLEETTQQLVETEKKRVAKSAAEKGDKDAVQEPSATEVPLRKRAGGGEGVRQKDTGKRKAAKEVVKVEAKPEEKVDVLGKAVNDLTPDEWSSVIGSVEGPARSNAKNEELSIDDALMLKKMIIKVIKDGVAAGKSSSQIVDQIEALTKGGVKHSGINRIYKLLDAQQKPEEKVTPEQKWDIVATQYGLPVFVDLPGAAQADVITHKGAMTLAFANEVYENNKTAIEQAKFGKSKGKDVAPTTPYTAKELIDELKAFLRVDTLGRRVQVVDTPEQLADLKDVVVGLAEERAFGWTRDGKAILIASRIQKGQGRAKFMHEVGTHLGLEGLLPQNLRKNLTDQITKWADSNSDSLESKLARRAIERVGEANTADEDVHAEMLAYFVEEAMQNGIDPTATKADTALGRWFRTLWAAFKTAIRKLGIKPESITPQDIIDLAFGAAKLEVSGTWHGTAAEFRKFDHKYMGSGEGAQAFGWGTYLAQKFGIAKEYWKDDVKRKDAMPVYNGKPMSAFDPEMQLTLGNIETAYKNGWYVHSAIEEMQGELTILSTDKNQSESDRARYKLLLDKLNSIDESKLDFLVHQQELAKHYGEELTQPVVHPETMETIFEPGLLIGPITAPKLAREMASAGIDEAEINGNIVQFKERKSIRPDGAMLRLDTAVSENEMYDWDKEIQQQSPEVKKALDEIKALIPQDVLDDIEYERNANWDELTGSQLVGDGYKNIGVLDQLLADGVITGGAKAKEAADAGKTHKAVSMLLEEHGIPGIKFYDRPSRANAAMGKTDKGITRNHVIFDPKNIIRVASQIAADRERVKFGLNATATFKSVGGETDLEEAPQSYDKISKRTQQWVGQSKGFIDNLPTWARGPVRTVHNVLFGGKETALGLMITEDIAEMAKKFMKSVTKYVEVQHLRNSLIATKERRLTSIKTAFEDLDTNTRRAVNNLISDMTINGKWAFDPQLEGVKPENIDEALKSRFNALPAGAQKVVKEVFAVGRESLQEKKETIRKIIDDEFNERSAAATTEAEKADVIRRKTAMEKQFAGILKINPNTPYAPLKRFGSFVVVAKSQAYLDAEAVNDKKEMRKLQSDESHYVVEFAETAGEAEQIYDALNAMGGYKVSAPFKKSTARDSLYRGTDLYKGFAKLKRVLAAEKGVEASLRTKDAELLGRLETMVNDLYLLSLADSSARKSEMERKKIAGFNRDMMRAFFTQGMADAHYIANLKTADQSMDVMVQMQKEAGENRAQAYPYLNEIMAREAQSLEIREPSLGDAMNRMAGDWFLTFSPSFYFQQMTQTYVLSLPWLAGKYNYFKSERALRQAYKQILPLIKGTGLKEHMDFSKAPEDVREMLKILVGRGRIDIGVEAELGGFRSEATNPMSEAYNNAANRMRGAINRIEALNRSVAAIAAYRLEMQKSGDKTKAIEAADKVVHVTHGSYDGFNTPRLFNKNAVTRSLTQFRRFQIIQLSMLARMVHNAFKGANKIERAMGRKQLAFLLGHTFALGGVKGMPIYVPAALAYSLITGAFGDEDDPEDFEAWLRSKGGLLLARGIPANMGIDLSGKLGMGNVLSLLPYTDVDLSSKQGYANLLLGASGPFLGGLVPKMIDGVNLVAGGDYYRGLEQMLPNGLNNGIKVLRFNTEGITMRNGDVVMAPEEIGFADSMFQLAGLPTATMTERQYTQGQVIKFDQFYGERAKEVKKDYIRAYKDNDPAAMAEARDAWNNLQESRVKYGYTRKPLSELIKAPREQAKRERSVVGGVETTKSNKGFVRSITEE